MKIFTQFLIVLLAIPSVASAALPVFSASKPAGMQRGVDTKISFTGDRLEDFEGAIFYSPGISLKSVDKVEKGKVDATISIAPDVPLGNHFLRLRTKSGISFMRHIMVGPYPNVEEKEPNNDFETPQLVEFNQTIEGLVGSEDVDYYKVAAKKGQRISLEIEGLRLGHAAFDSFIAVFNSKRFELASSDDTILNVQDGYLSMIAPEDGDYIVQVRESSYRGSGNSFYRLHVGSFRRPDVCYPSGGKIGTTQKIKFIESDGGVIEEDVVLPSEPTNKYPLYLKENPAPSGNVLRVSPYDNAMEVEPNDTVATATNTGMSPPLAINGIIEKPGDIDFFKLKLVKGQKVDFITYAQTLGSPLDSVAVVYNAAGGGLASNDDGNVGSRKLDSKFVFTAPEDGEYPFSITDHLGRGGANFVYRIEAEASVPSVTFSSPDYSVNDSQKRQFIAVPRGNRYATLVNIIRNNASGDMTFDLPNLPPGVKVIAPVILGTQNSFPLLFEADVAAPLSGASVPITLKPNDPAQKVVGKLSQIIDIVRVGNTIYKQEKIDKLPVAVIEEVPYTLELVKPTVPIVTNGSLNLKVIAKRKEGFKAAIRVLMLWRPPGINSQGEVEIPAEQNEATFTLDSQGDVVPGTYQFTVMGEAEGGNGTIYAASPYTDITVTPAHITGTVQLTAVDQGKETDFVCTLEQKVPFEGEATAQIIGVPTGVTVGPITINKGSKDVIFKVKTDATAPVGKHATLFCQVDVPVPGGTTIHRIAGGSILRIDTPPPMAAAPVVAAAAAPVVAGAPPAVEAPKKQLTRLEQLRLDQNKAAAK